MALWLTEFCFARRSLARHCEQSEATQKNWIAAPPVAARDDEKDIRGEIGSTELVSKASVSPTSPPCVSGPA